VCRYICALYNRILVTLTHGCLCSQYTHNIINSTSVEGLKTRDDAIKFRPNFAKVRYQTHAKTKDTESQQKHGHLRLVPGQVHHSFQQL